ncbi:MAG TPA: hypothetical protein PK529_01230 [Verrucomicrobiales bacterium]|jgi:hypothetical protein|nr:hypothetical protein [Verrucomicrobiales bacterium]
MRTFRFLSSLIAAVVALFLVSCETLDKGPEPPREKLSSMPHNMPASWEGQGGMPGMMSGQY